MIHLVIKPVGRLGNRLFQYLSNEFIGNQIAEYSDVTIVKPGIDELNIPSTANYRDYEKVQPHFILKGNSIENQISEILNINERDVLVESYFTGLNLKYLHQIPDEIKKAIKFEPSSQLEHAGNIVAHIRGGDIWKNGIFEKPHPNYLALPLDYYKKISETFNKPIKFLCEPEMHLKYSKMLKSSFGKESLLENGSSGDDFRTLLHAEYLALSVSTFSWMAAYLGKPKEIHYPSIGLFDPNKRPDIQLFPHDDYKWYKWYFSEHLWKGNRCDFKWILESPAKFESKTCME